MNNRSYLLLFLAYVNSLATFTKIPPSTLFTNTVVSRDGSSRIYTLKSITCSQVGTKHEYNEDFYSFLNEQNVALWLIFDGHRGSLVAEHLAKHLAKRIKDKITLYTRGKKNIHVSPETIIKLLKKTCYEINEEILHSPFAESGSTAAIVLLFDNVVYSAHIGDSRTLFLFNNGHYDVTLDQRPYIPQEQERIENKRPYVNLSVLSRVFGRKSFITNHSTRAKNAEAAEPECTYYPLESIRAIVMASDGFWDGMASTTLNSSEDIPFYENDDEVRFELLAQTKPFVKKLKKMLPIIECNERLFFEFVDEQLVRESQFMQEKQRSKNPFLPQGSDDSSVTLILVT